jgi:hypothetical protein
MRRVAEDVFQIALTPRDAVDAYLSLPTTAPGLP